MVKIEGTRITMVRGDTDGNTYVPLAGDSINTSDHKLT